jgi:hypothetical protein
VTRGSPNASDGKPDRYMLETCVRPDLTQSQVTILDCGWFNKKQQVNSCPGWSD